MNDANADGKVKPSKAEPNQQLESAQRYWEGVQRVTKGRFLHGAEWAIAADAWSRYIAELQSAGHSDVDTAEAPKPSTIPKITPFELAQVAAFLACQDPKRASGPVHTRLSEARELLIQAASYLEECTSSGATELLQLSGVTFEAILASNQKDNLTSLKLLPGIMGGNATGAERFKGLSDCIRRFYSQRNLRPTQVEKSNAKAVGIKLPDEIQDLTGEAYISGRFLPTAELVKIRYWSFLQKRRAATAPTQRSQQK